MKTIFLTGLLWIAWFASWIAASFWTNKTVRRLNLRAELKYRAVTFFGLFLLFVLPAQSTKASWHLWSVNNAIAWLCLGLVAVGFAFAWWARIHIGRLWSGSITHKENHHIIDTGPYQIVRHPIYTGVSFAIVATVIQYGTINAVIGGILIIFSFWLKARLEEQWLASELGAHVYEDYKQRVPMLIPFLSNSQ